MPEVQAETPPQRMMRQWYQGKLTERMSMMAGLLANRAMLRRGAFKMQDGTLGQATGEPTAEEDMQIRVGDEIHNHYEAESSRSNQSPTGIATKRSLLSRAAPLLLAGAMGTGIGIPAAAGVAWAMGLFGKPAAVIPADTDTQYILRLSGGD